MLFATLLATLAIGAMLPVLPRYVAGPLGGNDVMVGVVMGCYTLTALLCRPFAGRLSDRHGRRPVALAGAGALAVSGLLLFMPGGVAAVIAARLVLGLGLGTMNTASNLWLVDAAPHERRGEVVGLLGLAIWAGLAAGPLVGEALLSVSSYDAVWALVMLSPLVAAVVARRIPVVPVPPIDAPGGSLLPRVAVAPGVALLLSTIGWGTASGFVVLHLAERGVGAAAGVLAAFGAALVVTRVLLGRVPDRVGARPAAIAGSIAQAVALGVLAVAPSSVVALAGGVLLGAGTSFVYPALALMVVERARPADRGPALGAFTSFFDAGVGLGAPLAGFVALAAGYEAAFWVAAGCVALCPVVVIATRPRPGVEPEPWPTRG